MADRLWQGVVRTAKLPTDSTYESGLVTKTVHVGQEIAAFDFFEKANAFILGIKQQVDYKLSEDEAWAPETMGLLPQIDRGSIKLLDQKSWSIIDSHDLDIGETILCLKTLTLETSEITPSPRSLVAIGTALLRGDDSHLQGRIYIFDVIPVVPDPDSPSTTDRALKLISREEVKGAVTSISPIGTQGFLLMAQGQKVMVRGLKEDNSLMPVAFMDMQVHTTVLKSLGETGLWAAGDAIKGLWFCGYNEDPYQLRLFGKSKHIEVMALEFLPDGKQLYIIVADADCNLHVLQYDPERTLLYHQHHLTSPNSLRERSKLISILHRSQVSFRPSSAPPFLLPHRIFPDKSPPTSPKPKQRLLLIPTTLRPPNNVLRLHFSPHTPLPNRTPHSQRSTVSSAIHASSSLGPQPESVS